MFSEKDITQIEAHGLTVAQAQEQMERFRHGFPYLRIRQAATVGNGIVRLTAEQVRQYGERYRSLAADRKIVKFVPASGAATRMFKDLYGFLDSGKPNDSVAEVLDRIDDFAFAEELKRATGNSSDPRTLIEGIVVRPGLGYGHLPKGLILFHRYAEEVRTALEEHLAEGALYARGNGGEVAIHLTVSPEHREAFEELVRRVLPDDEKRYGVTFRIDYSQQEPATDTLAANEDNTPFRDAAGGLAFRPAGHGALLENLNRIDADLVFIKNIDNVAPDRLKADTVVYKQALGGLLFALQQQSFDYLRMLDDGATNCLDEIAAFLSGKLCRRLPIGIRELPGHQRALLLHDLLNRPLRVCGMVRNEGEPGGGPFWVAEADGSESLQIAEAAQIAPAQRELLATSTHFNPVDLACGLRDYRGEKFDLMRFTDPQTGLISTKSQQGRPLKALELPGLWNGAMARWNTVFVEVPITTFSPVKTVNDLLRPQHRELPSRNG